MSKKILSIIYRSLFNFLLAFSLFMLTITINGNLRGNPVDWYLLILLLITFFVSLFFLYLEQNTNLETTKGRYIYLIVVLVLLVVFWKDIIGLWQSTPNEIQTSVVNKSWNLLDTIFGAVVGGLIVGYITIREMKKYFGNPKTK